MRLCATSSNLPSNMALQQQFAETQFPRGYLLNIAHAPALVAELVQTTRLYPFKGGSKRSSFEPWMFQQGIGPTCTGTKLWTGNCLILLGTAIFAASWTTDLLFCSLDVKLFFKALVFTPAQRNPCNNLPNGQSVRPDSPPVRQAGAAANAGRQPVPSVPKALYKNILNPQFSCGLPLLYLKKTPQGFLESTMGLIGFHTFPKRVPSKGQSCVGVAGPRPKCVRFRLKREPFLWNLGCQKGGQLGVYFFEGTFVGWHERACTRKSKAFGFPPPV